jgi:(S)-citramalyl-CoA lyase
MDRLAAVRVLLFVPGNREDRIEKALGAGADAVVIDLEDSVSDAHKDDARAAALGALDRSRRQAGPQPPPLIGLRPNRVTTRHGLGDLVALLEAAVKPDFLVLPKVESPFEPQLIAGLMGGDWAGELLCTIESARGLEHASQIAAACPSVAALGFGGVDLAGELGARLAWEPMLPARARVTWATAAAGACAFDVPFLDLGSPGSLEEECLRARDLGFSGKFAVHPSQVGTIRRAFTPSPEDVAAARALLLAAARADGDAVAHEGTMLDAAVMRRARRTLERAAE